MRIIEKKVYKFEELSNSIKEEVKNKYMEDFGRENNNDDFEEFANEILNFLGFEGCQCEYSLSYCQGDGVTFTFKLYNDDIIKLLNFLKANEPKEKGYKALEDIHNKLFNIVYDFNIDEDSINNNDMMIYTEKNYYSGYYSHKRTKNICINTDEKDEYAENARQIFEEIYYTICNFLEKEGYEQIYQEMEDEDFSDTAEANDWEYYENGERY